MGVLLLMAVEASDSDMVRFLLSDRSAKKATTSRNGLSIDSPRYGYLRSCDIFNSYDLPPAVYGTAISQKDDTMIRLLLEHDTALYLASDPGAFALALQIAPHIYQALVHKVLSYNSSSNRLQPSEYFDAAWSEAISLKRPDMLYLMASNLTILRDVDDHIFFRTPNFLALEIEYKEGGPLRFLLDCGLDLDAPHFDEDGYHRPKVQLQRFSDGSRRPCYTMLLKYIESQDLQAIRTLLDLGASIDRPAKHGIKRTPLQKAAEIGSLSVIKLLLSRRADIHSPPATRGGGTPAQLAAIGGFIGVVQYLEKHGDDLWAPGSIVNGRTALEGAAEHGRYEMVHWLASRKPPDLMQYEKAAGFAKENGHSAIATMLASMYQARIAEITPIVPRLTQSASNVRRHVCKTCSAVFGRATTLRRHERSHKETFPCRCEECCQGFRRKDTLDRHIETHSGGTHQCHICGSEHSRRDVLLKHMRDEHDDAQL